MGQRRLEVQHTCFSLDLHLALRVVCGLRVNADSAVPLEDKNDVGNRRGALF